MSGASVCHARADAVAACSSLAHPSQPVWPPVESAGVGALARVGPPSPALYAASRSGRPRAVRQVVCSWRARGCVGSGSAGNKLELTAQLNVHVIVHVALVDVVCSLTHSLMLLIQMWCSSVTVGAATYAASGLIAGSQVGPRWDRRLITWCRYPKGASTPTPTFALRTAAATPVVGQQARRSWHCSVRRWAAWTAGSVVRRSRRRSVLAHLGRCARDARRPGRGGNGSPIRRR